MVLAAMSEGELRPEPVFAATEDGRASDFAESLTSLGVLLKGLIEVTRSGTAPEDLEATTKD